MVQAAGHGARAEKTRTAVLEAGETLFAQRGFDATRLEDIADRVGIRRASIVYYFRDKRELYDAVLGNVFGDLHGALAEALSRDLPLRERIDAGVSAWVDFVCRRPTVARIILREQDLAAIQQELKTRKGVDFNTSNQEAVFSMLKYWCREAAKGEADVEAVTQTDDRFLVNGNKDFLTALQAVL